MRSPQPASLPQVAALYRERLEAALSLARLRFPAINALRLTPIDDSALQAALGWPDHARAAGWDWAAVARRVVRSEPKSFHVALWHGDMLCGLAGGRVRTPHAVGIHFVEGAPGEHPLRRRVTPIVLTAAEAYRTLLGCAELRLYDAMPALVPHYQRFGFRLAPELGKPHHMRR